jgi:hypothetical protein
MHFVQNIGRKTQGVGVTVVGHQKNGPGVPFGTGQRVAERGQRKDLELFLDYPDDLDEFVDLMVIGLDPFIIGAGLDSMEK